MDPVSFREVHGRLKDVPESFQSPSRGSDGFSEVFHVASGALQEVSGVTREFQEIPEISWAFRGGPRGFQGERYHEISGTFRTVLKGVSGAFK